MKKIFLYVLFATIFGIGANAQEWIDVIYLKNGSHIKGVIIEQIPGKTYRIQTSDGGSLVCNVEEIEKITREQNAEVAKASSKHVTNGKFNKPKGYYGLIEFQALSVSVSSGAFGSFGIDMVNGYRFCPQFALGLGIGVEGTNNFAAYQIPIYLHLRSDFLNTKVSPYMALNVGFVGGSLQGLMIKPQAGISFNVGKKRMSVAFNYKAFAFEGNIDFCCDHEIGLCVGLTL